MNNKIGKVNSKNENFYLCNVLTGDVVYTSIEKRQEDWL
jgi:hypothetical protein